MDRAIPVIPASDLRVARTFYRDGLGFSVRFDVSDNGIEGLLGVERNGMAITLDCPMDGHGRNACVSLEVADADAYFDEWKQRVEIKRGPQNEPWGKRTFSVTDPFGNTIFVIGPAR